MTETCRQTKTKSSAVKVNLGRLVQVLIMYHKRAAKNVPPLKAGPLRGGEAGPFNFLKAKKGSDGHKARGGGR